MLLTQPSHLLSESGVVVSLGKHPQIPKEYDRRVVLLRLLGLDQPTDLLPCLARITCERLQPSLLGDGGHLLASGAVPLPVRL